MTGLQRRKLTSQVPSTLRTRYNVGQQHAHRPDIHVCHGHADHSHTLSGFLSGSAYLFTTPLLAKNKLKRTRGTLRGDSSLFNTKVKKAFRRVRGVNLSISSSKNVILMSSDCNVGFLIHIILGDGKQVALEKWQFFRILFVVVIF